MLRWISIAALLALPLVASAQDAPEAQDAPDAPVRLDVRTCVQRATLDNPQALAARQRMVARGAEIGLAKARRRPNVSAGVAYNYVEGLEEDLVDIPLVEELVGVSSLQPEARTTAIRFTIDQVLYAGGQIKAAIKASRHLAASEAWQAAATVQALAYETKEAYYNALLTQALVEVAESSVAARRRHAKDARTQFDDGYISRFELLRADTELGASEADVTAARTAASIARMNLLRLINLPLDTPVELAEELAWDPIDQPLPALLAEALAARPELQALEETLAAAGQQVRVRRGEYLPNAAASATWQSVDGGGVAMPDGWTVTVGADWELYAGGRRKASVNAARAERREVEHELAALEDLVELDVRQARERIEEARAATETEEATVTLAEEGLRLAELRFREGVGIYADVLDAEAALTTSRTGLAQALHDYALAVAALERAIGRGPLPAALEEDAVQVAMPEVVEASGP